MEITNKLKERFCKDCNIPIKIYDEPYFTDRLILFDNLYGTLEKWNLFLEELKKYNREQDYFEEYNNIKDEAIMNIKYSEAYQKFNEEDMSKFQVTHKNLPNKDIFKPTNDNKIFISIDMKKANFSALSHYGDSISQSMFAGASTWEDFISLFTNNKHIINSKYIRQVILGNCNPKRHITYEKYLMDKIIDILLTELKYQIEDIVFFSNDEIVLDITRYVSCLRNGLVLKDNLRLLNIEPEYSIIPVKIELFKLHKIKGTDGYYKEILDENGYEVYHKKNYLEEKENIKIELKCVDNYMMPFVIRKLKGEEITSNDKVFYHEGLLSQFVEIPKIEVM